MCMQLDSDFFVIIMKVLIDAMMKGGGGLELVSLSFLHKRKSYARLNEMRSFCVVS